MICDLGFYNLFYAKTFKGTPLAIYDFGICFMQTPLGGHFLRSVVLDFEFLQNLRGTPLAICVFGIREFTKP